MVIGQQFEFPATHASCLFVLGVIVAEHMEHAVSDSLVDRIDAFLGHPKADPHGDPIPTADGTMRGCDEASAVRQMSSSESRKHGSSKPMRAARRRNTSEFGSDSPTGAIAGLLASTYRWP